MKFRPHSIYHVYNQGNNHQQLFFGEEDYVKFLELYESYIQPYVDTIAWCLIPNHFHFMLFVKENCVEVKQGGLILDSVTNGFRKLLSAYAHYFNEKHQHSGSVFRPKTKAKELEIKSKTNYYMNCFYYIHQNAWRHGLVKHSSLWKFSSYSFYAGKRIKSLCNKNVAKDVCEYDIKTFVMLVEQSLPDDLLNGLF
jgi:REP element-mobilizing transposase RayT